MARRFLKWEKEGSGRKGSPKERWMDQKAVCLTVDWQKRMLENGTCGETYYG